MLLSNQTFKIIAIALFINSAANMRPYPSNLSAVESLDTYNNKLMTRTDTISASAFGVKADYNGISGTDNRKALQLAIDYCSKNKAILQLPSGKILLNSYAGSPAAQAHGNILELTSNSRIIGNKSEIIVGSFFNDKNFIVFSGLNSPYPNDFKSLTNVILKNFVINFNASKSFMKTRYLLRKGVELGHTIDGEISFCKFLNGDISCAIATGFGGKNISRNIKIYANEFQNLASSLQNRDHTSIYLNSTNSSIYNNKFSNTLVQGKLVSCAAELHNSDTRFVSNKIFGYTRMMFLVATASEHTRISNLTIANNQANITNAAIYLWLDSNTSIDGILIENNSIESNHVNGYSKLYNGTQGIIADARNEANTSIHNMQLLNNKTLIKTNIIKGRAVNYATKYAFKSINNTCIGCKDGLFFK